jgi:transposase
MIGKYLDHLPLYRLEQIAARDGVILSRSTLADWVGRLGVALQPLADRLAWHLLQRDSLHADETPVPQLDPGNGKTKKAYLWAYRSNDLQPGPKIIVFDYQAGRSGRHAQQFLQDWHGHLWSTTTAATKPCLRQPRASRIATPARTVRRTGLPGACAAQILRPVPGQSEPDRARSLEPHRQTVCGRSRSA